MSMAGTYTSVHEALERVAHDRPFSAARLVLVGVLGLVGMAALVLWPSAAFTAYDGFANGFARAGIPGQVTVDAVPDPYFVYAEGEDAAALPRFRVRVADPTGRAVPVQSGSPSPIAYEHTAGQHRAMGNVVAWFRATQVGRYRVAVTGEPTTGRFAVGRTPFGSGATWIAVNRWGMAALWLVVVGTSLWIAFAPVIPHGWRFREHRIALLTLFLGIPAAYVAATVWDGFAVPQTSTHGSRGVHGWQAVLYDLPGWLLLVGVAGTSLAFAALGLRARVRGARWGLWASGVGLLLVLLLFATTVADTVRESATAGPTWVVQAVVALLAAAVTLGARRWALGRS